jgi:hypothetical protein
MLHENLDGAIGFMLELAGFASPSLRGYLAMACHSRSSTSPSIGHGA